MQIYKIHTHRIRNNRLRTDTFRRKVAEWADGVCIYSAECSLPCGSRILL